MPTKVVHCKQEKFDIYIGRPSIWGNPYSDMDPEKTLAEYHVDSREEAIEMYRKWILQQPALIRLLPTLKNKTLGCWCKPDACHGDVLVELIEGNGEHSSSS